MSNLKYKSSANRITNMLKILIYFSGYKCLNWSHFQNNIFGNEKVLDN